MSKLGLDASRRPVTIPPDFVLYAEKYQVFDLKQVRSKLTCGESCVAQDAVEGRHGVRARAEFLKLPPRRALSLCRRS